jgi:hypothetical protein
LEEAPPAPPTAPVQMTVDPLDYGIPEAEPPRVFGRAEPPRGMQIIRPWRQGQQLFLRTARNGGYIINYSFVPARVSKWLNYGQPQNITPLPSNDRLLFKYAEYLKESPTSRLEIWTWRHSTTCLQTIGS